MAFDGFLLAFASTVLALIVLPSTAFATGTSGGGAESVTFTPTATKTLTGEDALRQGEFEFRVYETDKNGTITETIETPGSVEIEQGKAYEEGIATYDERVLVAIRRILESQEGKIFIAPDPDEVDTLLARFKEEMQAQWASVYSTWSEREELTNGESAQATLDAYRQYIYASGDSSALVTRNQMYSEIKRLLYKFDSYLEKQAFEEAQKKYLEENADEYRAYLRDLGYSEDKVEAAYNKELLAVNYELQKTYIVSEGYSFVQELYGKLGNELLYMKYLISPHPASSGTNNTDGSVTFTPIELNGAGTYYYIIREVPSSTTSYVYDTHDSLVKAEVSYNDLGELTVEVTYPNSDNTFTNTVIERPAEEPSEPDTETPTTPDTEDSTNPGTNTPTNSDTEEPTTPDSSSDASSEEPANNTDTPEEPSTSDEDLQEAESEEVPANEQSTESVVVPVSDEASVNEASTSKEVQIGVASATPRTADSCGFATLVFAFAFAASITLLTCQAKLKREPQ